MSGTLTHFEGSHRAAIAQDTLETMPFYDAHCHLQDDRLAPHLAKALKACREAGIVGAVVNGVCEQDWPRVADLAQRFPEYIVPSFGLHPWHVKGASPSWRETLQDYWNRFPQSGVGEIGLDRWIRDADLPAQLDAFRWQLEFAAAQNRPTSIHCLKAWGALTEVLHEAPLPERGFLLHSFGGSSETLKALLPLGAHASLSAYFAHPRKAKQAEVFQEIPLERLLIETDCPDMLGPKDLQAEPIADPEGKPLNHPLALTRIYRFASQLLDKEPGTLERQVAANWKRFFRSNSEPGTSRREPGTSRGS